MPTLDELMIRTEIENPHRATISEIVRIGFRGSLDPDEAAQAIRTGRLSDSTEAEVVAQYQAYWKPDLDRLALRTYQREAKVDGVVGRVTLKSIEDRVCGVPDLFYADDGTLKPMSAKWPNECKDALTWHVDYSNFSEATFGLTKAAVEGAFAKVFRDMMSLFNVTTLPVGSRAEAKFQESFARLGGSTLGAHYLANNTCSPKTGQFNVMRWPSLEYLQQVGGHEATHGLGLGHVPGRTLMNPSIVWPLEGRISGTCWTQKDIDAVFGLGYSEGIGFDPEDPDDPDVPPGEGGIVKISGRLKNGTTFVSADVEALETTIRLGAKARTTFRYDS